MNKIKKIFQKSVKNFKKNKLFWFSFLIVLVAGVFFRTYNHENWLLFQLDQSRDALIITEAVESGPQKLPLLGPQAGGTGSDKIKLGPVFYYFQYVPALFLGVNPNTLAWPDLIFSILAIPLFYYFSRKYFSSWLSLGLTLIFSSSPFLIFYGRFAWNPNSIPFFLLLFLIGLLNIKIKNKKYLWVFFTAFSMSVLTQLHFITFFLAPFVFIIFLALNYQIINLKMILITLATIFVVSSPVILSEYQSKGENTKNLINEVFNRTEVSEDSELLEKSFESIQKISFYNWITLSSHQNLDEVKLKENKKGKLSFECDKECRLYVKNSFWAVLFSFIGFLLLIKSLLKEKDKKRKDFLTLNLIFIIGIFLIITPIIKGDHARFFLVGSISAFVFLGLILDFIKKIFNNKLGKLLIIIIISGFLTSNILAVKSYFKQQNDLSDLKNISEERRDLISPGGEKTTFLQLERIVGLIEKDAQENGINSIAFTADNYYARSINYIFENRKNIEIEKYFKLSDFDPPFFYNEVYYITRTNSSSHFKEEIAEVYDIISKKEMGSLIVYKIKKKN
jgi:4-amino-4-deoxy-L-arabinose transferase-like glycosyltransferase